MIFTVTLLTSLQVPLAWTSNAADPTRVLVVGDSLTSGIHGDYTWRYRLSKEFQRQQQPVDFVGSNTWPYVATGYSFATYADPGFDHDHFAWGGAQLQGQTGRIKAEVTKQNPDVVVLASGLNDLMHGSSPEQTAGFLRTFIANARAARPDVKIVVSPVLTIYRANLPAANGLINRYDDLAADVVTEVNTVESPVRMAPTMSGWSPNTLMVQDGIHATPRGEAFIAQRIAMGLQSVGVLPQSPPAAPTSVAWVRNLKPTVTLKGTSAVLTWDAQGLTSARIWARRRGGAWRQVATTSARSFTYALTPGAVYDFKVQGVRRVMTSTLSQQTTVNAPPLGKVGRVRVLRKRITWTAVYGATQYRVQYRAPRSTVWKTRVVRGSKLRVRAVVAQVSARNAFTTSAPTTGRR
jgi:lysophospholipase L1-like esterase